MRVGLRGMVRRVWGRRGVKVRQRVQLVYEWMYLFLVVDGRRGKLLWTWTDSMKSERIAAAVNGLKHQTDVGALVWDGARGHRSELVESVGVPTIVQPPYSPELNPAERVFEEVRRCVGQAVPAYRREGGGGERLSWRNGPAPAVHSSRSRWADLFRGVSARPNPWRRAVLLCVRARREGDDDQNTTQREDHQ